MCDQCILKAAHVLSAVLATSANVTPIGHDAEDATFAHQMCADMNAVVELLKPTIDGDALDATVDKLVDQMLVMGAGRIGNMVRLTGLFSYLLENVNRLGVATITALAEKGDMAAVAWLAMNMGHLATPEEHAGGGSGPKIVVLTLGMDKPTKPSPSQKPHPFTTSRIKPEDMN